MRIDMESYKLNGVRLSRSQNQYFQLTVEGLAERRPSLLVGDEIVAQAENSDRPFQGYIARIELTRVHVKFANSFASTWSNTQLYDIEFRINRTGLRRMHTAVETAPQWMIDCDVNKRPVPVRTQLPQIQPFNPNILKNAQQYLAVQQIVANTANHLPFLVFGPPGTGKTMTIIEAMKQVLKADPKARILAVAPSNTAADQIVARLDLPEDWVIRVNAPSRQMPDPLPFQNYRRYCRMADDGAFIIPDLSKLADYRVVVSTCITSWYLKDNQNYTHCFVDESGQAFEAEVLISIQ